MIMSEGNKSLPIAECPVLTLIPSPFVSEKHTNAVAEVNRMLKFIWKHEPAKVIELVNKFMQELESSGIPVDAPQFKYRPQ